MSNKNSGGPAFPVNEHKDHRGMQVEATYGMTIRDYFAAKAMQALLHSANPGDGLWGTEAKAAYEIADSMMEARDK